MYPEVESARLAGRVLVAVVALSIAAVAAVLAYTGAGAAVSAAVLAGFTLAGSMVSWRALGRPEILARKIGSFDSWCGGAERALRGASGVYYCRRGEFIVCYDPLIDRVHVVKGRESGSLRDPGRPDYRCTLRVKGVEREYGGGVHVFQGILYAPQPGRPGILVRVDGVEASVFVDCGDPAGAANRLLELAGRLGAEGAEGS